MSRIQGRILGRRRAGSPVPRLTLGYRSPSADARWQRPERKASKTNVPLGTQGTFRCESAFAGPGGRSLTENACVSKDEEYRVNATNLLWLAERAGSAADKVRLLELAESWMVLANRARSQARRSRKRSDVHPLIRQKLDPYLDWRRDKGF